MEQPRIDAIEKRLEKLEQEYAELKGQTEPIKITRLEIDPGGIQEQLAQANKRLDGMTQTQADHSERFDTLKAELLREIHTISDTWLESLQENADEVKEDISTFETEIEGARADILSLKATQSDHSELLREARADIASIKATQSDHGEILKTMATKGDLTDLEGRIKYDIASIKATQDLILQLLQQKSGE